MRISLQREAGSERKPVYRQIAEQIRREIEAERLAAGQRLPAIRDLAKSFASIATPWRSPTSNWRARAWSSRPSAGAPSCARTAGAPARPPPISSPSSRRSPERLLELERSRPRFGSAGDAVPMHSLVPDPSLYPADAFRRVLNRVLTDGGAPLLPVRRAAGAPAHARGDGGAPAQGRHRDRRRRHHPVSRREPGHLARAAPLRGRRRRDRRRGAHLPQRPRWRRRGSACARRRSRCARAASTSTSLERTLARPEVKALYTMPTFHNPIGTTTSLAHRRALLAVAARCGKPVIEDAYEMDLRFAGQARPGARRARPQRPRDPPLVVLEVALPRRAHRRDRGARARRRRAARAQGVERSLGRDAAAGRARGVRGRGRLRPPPRAPAPRAARAPRRAARGARARSARRARAGRRPRAATRSGWSCPRASTRAICWPTPSAPACSSRPARSSTTTAAPRAACASRSRWRTRRRCAAVSRRSAACCEARLGAAARPAAVHI